jgi:magnesium transporter
MINKNNYKDIVWVDLENPKPEEIRDIIEEYNISPIVAEELLSPTLRPKVDVHKDFMYLILHFPTAHSHKEPQKVKKTQEIDFLIGKNFIITVHYDSVDELHAFEKVFEVNSILNKNDMSEHAGYVFYFMIQHLYKDMMNKIESVGDLLADVEAEIFAGKEKQMVIELSKLNRIILTFKESFLAHKQVLESFEIAGEKFFGKEFKYNLRSILGEYYKVNSTINSTKSYLEELRSTNDSLLSTKQNEIMKVLTIMAFITFPLTVIAGLFGMNTIATPILGIENDFWIIIGIMGAMTISFYVWFRFKKWL